MEAGILLGQQSLRPCRLRHPRPMYDDEVQVPTAPPQPGLDDELDPLLGSWPILGIPFGNIFDVVLVDVAADAKGIDAINIIPDGVCLRGHFQRNMIMCLRSCWQHFP